jgi:hypothetical protein
VEREMGRRTEAYSAYDVVMVGEVSFASLAAVDSGGVEVDVVRQPHLGF